MKADNFDTPTNPYHYVLHCIGGKWKMTILHEIYTYGSIRFNQTLKILPISEKVFSQQLKELERWAVPHHGGNTTPGEFLCIINVGLDV